MKKNAKDWALRGAILLIAALIPACSSSMAQPEGAAPSAPAAETLTVTALASSSPTIATVVPTAEPTVSPTPELNPLSIEWMRARQYPGSDIKIEQTLTPGSNYKRYIASYQSDGLKIFALLTVPNGTKPAHGWPVIIFNHGYIPPKQYKTTERYVAYVDAFARNGYIVFKSDYRGHGQSEGQAQGGYGSPDYTVDVLNAVASVKRFKDADPDRIGMWGHSMGGQVTLRAMVVSRDIKAGVIWGGVVAPYPDILEHWKHPTGGVPDPGYGRHWRQDLITTYGTPEQNPQFWASISPNSYLGDLSGPLQLDHATTDPEVPVAFSEELAQEMRAAGKTVELYLYPGDNHNLSNNLTLALQRSVAFFNKYLKP